MGRELDAGLQEALKPPSQAALMSLAGVRAKLRPCLALERALSFLLMLETEIDMLHKFSRAESSSSCLADALHEHPLPVGGRRPRRPSSCCHGRQVHALR